MIDDKATIIAQVCNLISDDRIGEAGDLLHTYYPFQPIEKHPGNITPKQKTCVFVRDGFIDRYRGNRLIYPPVLYLISNFLPIQFPADPNWKMSATHIAFWELFPTVDHVVPRARGGAQADGPPGHRGSAWQCQPQKHKRHGARDESGDPRTVVSGGCKHRISLR